MKEIIYLNDGEKYGKVVEGHFVHFISLHSVAQFNYW